MESAGRIGSRQGKVSELTFIAPFAPGGAKRLRALLQLLEGNFSARTGSAPSTTCASCSSTTTRSCSSPRPTTAMGSLYRRLRNEDSRQNGHHLLRVRRLAGIHSPKVKDWIVKHQITAEGWFVAHPDLTVAETDGRSASARRWTNSSTRSVRQQGRRQTMESGKTRTEGEVSHDHANTDTQAEQDRNVEQKIQKLRELHADAPEIGKAALENGLGCSRRAGSAGAGANRRPHRRPSGKGLGAHRVPSVRERGSEAASRLLQVLEGNFRAADAVGTVHNMRFVFVDNDTKLLFATAYDGDWDPYIEDFAAKIPNAMDLWLCNFEGFPGMRNRGSGGLDRQTPDRGRSLVRQQSESDRGGDPTARKGRRRRR